jgi:hypothetical protein
MSDEDKKDYTRAVDRCPDPVLKAKAISIFKNGTNTEKLRVTKEILKLIADREAKQNAQDNEKRSAEWTEFMRTQGYRYLWQQ